jgi:hypothetical protein
MIVVLVHKKDRREDVEIESRHGSDVRKLEWEVCRNGTRACIGGMCNTREREAYDTHVRRAKSE